MKKVFVSYSSKQGPWVWDRLVPVLKAGGVEVLIDRERFGAGKALIGQMDAVQDTAEVQLLLFSEDYLKSDNCKHEMDRAIAKDPGFRAGIVIPVVVADCGLPNAIKDPNPLQVRLIDDKNAGQWQKLMEACGGELGCEVPDWLKGRHDIRRYLRRKQSVNLVVNNGVKWKELINNLVSVDDPDGALPPLPRIDLQKPMAASRQALIRHIIQVLGGHPRDVNKPYDLVELDKFFDTVDSHAPKYLVLENFDWVATPDRLAEYGLDFFGALRSLTMDQRKLVLLIQSKASLASILPRDHPLSSGLNAQVVELRDGK